MNDQQFSETEIQTLRKGVTGAGTLVALSDRSFFDTFKEAGALAQHLAQAGKGTQSPLIRQVAAGRGLGFGITDSPTEIESETTEALKASVQLLQTKAPNEMEAYRSLVLEIARSVSEAAGGGDEQETAAIEKITSALGGEPAASTAPSAGTASAG